MATSKLFRAWSHTVPTNIDLIRMSDTKLYTRTHEENSALHKAVRGGHEDVVAFFVESGVQLDPRNLEGTAALEVLVEVNKRGDSPVHS